MNGHSSYRLVCGRGEFHTLAIAAALLTIPTSPTARGAQAFYPFDAAPIVSTVDGTFVDCPLDQLGAENLCNGALQTMQFRRVALRNGSYGVDVNGDGVRDGTLTLDAELLSEVYRLPDGRYHYMWQLSNLGLGAFIGFQGNNTPQFAISPDVPLLGSAGLDRIPGSGDDPASVLAARTSLDSEYPPGSEAWGIVVNPATGLVGTMLAPLSDVSGPPASILSLTPNPARIGASRMLIAGIDDVDTGNSTIAGTSFRIDAGPWVPMAATDGLFDEVIESVQATLPEQSSADVQEVCVRGTDSRGNTGSPDCVLSVSYDSSGGFATGGGWIDAVDAMDHIGFVAKYQKGSDRPQGQLEFQSNSINLHASSFEWLVVSGTEALLKGAGLINGMGAYGFLLHVIDDPSGDRIRMQVWNAANQQVVYDNETGTEPLQLPTTPLANGQVIVHPSKK
jgi:hypothetical protein